MSSDGIVERLRAFAAQSRLLKNTALPKVYDEAADLIERLQAELAEIHAGAVGQLPAPSHYTEVGKRNYMIGHLNTRLAKSETDAGQWELLEERRFADGGKVMMMRIYRPIDAAKEPV